MQFDQAKEIVRENWKDVILHFTTVSKDGKGFICPVCNHGANGDGLVANPRGKDRYSLTCFGGGCEFRSGDIIRLYMKTYNVGFKEAVTTLAGYLNITIDNPERTERHKPLEAASIPTDYNSYYDTCRARIIDKEAVAYLNGRGISIETAKAAGIGYDPQADPAQSGFKTKRIIIPTSSTHYVARAIDPAAKIPKLNPKGSTPGIFNKAVLYTEEVQEVFICEGAFDALAIIEAGAAAIALNSAVNADKLIRELEARPTRAALIIAMDSDTAGNAAAHTIIKGLQRLNIPFITANINGAYKDPAEHLQNSREAFIEAVTKAARQAQAKPDNTLLYMQDYMAGDLTDYQTDIDTGFSNLDAETGGLYPGLYILAAVSSQGKTTFALQLADNIATAGKDVIIFSLEQSKLELVSKSIARIAAESNTETFVTARSIMKQTNTDLKDHLEYERAAANYKDIVGDRVSIVQGDFKCDTSFIGEYLRGYIARNKVTPVAIIDYLQILQPRKEERRRGTTKEAIDSVVTDIKRLSRELMTPIIGIASVNRAGYLSPLSFESIKESGNIEFTADVILGLQFRCMNDPEYLKQDAAGRNKILRQESMKRPRAMEIVCLKNRYGRKDFKLYFDYYSRNDLFIPCENSAGASGGASIATLPRKKPRKHETALDNEWIETFTDTDN